MSNKTFYVVNDRERFSTPIAAIEFAARTIHLDPIVTLAAVSYLCGGKPVKFSYGFTTIEIKPVRVDTYAEAQLSAIETANYFSSYRLELRSNKGKTNYLNITPEQFAKIKDILVYSGEAK